jgi:hypothetical protein
LAAGLASIPPKVTDARQLPLLIQFFLFPRRLKEPYWAEWLALSRLQAAQQVVLPE